MATHSTTLAWRIPWTEGPGGLWSMGSHRVGHDWATNTQTMINMLSGTSQHKEDKFAKSQKRCQLWRRNLTNTTDTTGLGSGGRLSSSRKGKSAQVTLLVRFQLKPGASLVVVWRLRPSSAGGAGVTPDWGTHIPYATQCRQIVFLIQKKTKKKTPTSGIKSSLLIWELRKILS